MEGLLFVLVIGLVFSLSLRLAFCFVCQYALPVTNNTASKSLLPVHFYAGNSRPAASDHSRWRATSVSWQGCDKLAVKSSQGTKDVGSKITLPYCRNVRVQRDSGTAGKNCVIILSMILFMTSARQSCL